MRTKEIDGVEFVRFADPDELLTWVSEQGWTSEQLEVIIGQPVVGALLHRWIRAYLDDRGRRRVGIHFRNVTRVMN